MKNRFMRLKARIFPDSKIVVVAFWLTGISYVTLILLVEVGGLVPWFANLLRWLLVTGIGFWLYACKLTERWKFLVPYAGSRLGKTVLSAASFTGLTQAGLNYVVALLVCSVVFGMIGSVVLHKSVFDSAP